MKIQPEKIIISDDLSHLPAPYCYRFKIEIELEKEVEISFDIEYYDRDELTAEEIEAEGFSMDDNFHWHGNLPNAWKEEILQQLDKTDSGPNKKGTRIVTITSGKTTHHKPKNKTAFEVFTQELIQAIYEASEKQVALSIAIICNSKNGVPEKYRLDISFLNRNALLAHDKSSEKINWGKAQRTLEQLFQFDFDPFNVVTKPPKKEGLYVDAGEGYWYEAGVGIKTLDKKNPKEEILRLFRGLLPNKQ